MNIRHNAYIHKAQVNIRKKTRVYKSCCRSKSKSSVFMIMLRLHYVPGDATTVAPFCRKRSAPCDFDQCSPHNNTDNKAARSQAFQILGFDNDRRSQTMTMTATNHHDQRHNLVKFIQRCREFGDFLKVRH